MKINRATCIQVDKRASGLAHRDNISEIDKELYKHFNTGISSYNCGNGELMALYWYDYIDRKVGGREQAYNYGNMLLNLFMQAKIEDLDNWLLLEDDADINIKYKDNFGEVLKSRLDEFESTGVEWDCLYLGGNVKECMNAIQISEHIVGVDYVLDMQAVLWNKSSYDKVLNIMPSNEVTIDGVLAQRVKNGILKAFVIIPVLITSYENFSFNENKLVNRSNQHIL